MNANELADKWNAQGFSEYELERECGNQMANMLRQQADRIRNLEKTLGFKNSGYETINLTPPVAWMHKTIPSWVSTFIHPETEPDEWQPLYTHPVKEQDESFDRTASHMAGKYVSYKKELTDEEIDELANKYLYVLNDVPYANDIKDFARAILRKAQEK